MENIIIFLIVGGIVIFNLVTNYKKEVKKNKERPITPVPTVISEETIARPFSKKKEKTSVNRKPVYQEELSEKFSFTDEKKGETLSRANMGMPIMSEVIEAEDISEANSQSENTTKGYLNLDTPSDCRKAFIHSLIFERKY